MKDNIVSIVISSTFLSFTFIVISAFGCITFSSCFLIDFNAIVNLITYIPPPAEPAHAPMKLDKKTIVIIKVGQLL